MLDSRIQTFLTLCHEKNYTETAKKLFITQPAVTQHIQSLEALYGVKLTANEGKKFGLTKAGEYLFRNGEQIRTDLEKIERKLRSFGEAELPLRIGATKTVGEYWMPDLLRTLTDTNRPFTFHMDNTARLTQQLLLGDIDCAFCEGYVDKSAVDFAVFCTESLICVGSPRLFTNDKMELPQLLQYTVLLREPGSGTREVLERNLKERGLTVNDFSKSMEFENIGVLKKLASIGVGISFLYRIAVEQELLDGSLVEVQLESFQPTHDFTFLMPKGSRFFSQYRQDLLGI